MCTFSTKRTKIPLKAFNTCLLQESIVGHYYEMRISFYISDTPGAPNGVKIDDYDRSSASLVWKAPDSDGGNPIKGKIFLSSSLEHFSNFII